MNDEILKRLDALAEAFGTTGATLVREIQNVALIQFWLGIAGLILGAAAVRWGIRGMDNHDEGAVGVALIGGGIVCFVGLFAAGFGFTDYLAPHAAVLGRLGGR